MKYYFNPKLFEFLSDPIRSNRKLIEFLHNDCRQMCVPLVLTVGLAINFKTSGKNTLFLCYFVRHWDNIDGIDNKLKKTMNCSHHNRTKVWTSVEIKSKLIVSAAAAYYCCISIWRISSSFCVRIILPLNITIITLTRSLSKFSKCDFLSFHCEDEQCSAFE